MSYLTTKCLNGSYIIQLLNVITGTPNARKLTGNAATRELFTPVEEK